MIAEFDMWNFLDFKFLTNFNSLEILINRTYTFERKIKKFPKSEAPKILPEIKVSELYNAWEKNTFKSLR